MTKLRWAHAGDHAALAEAMFDAVRNGPSRYSEEQRAVWVPTPRSGPEWERRLEAQDIILAEGGDQVIGFMSLASGGYIDFAYIRPRAQGTGLFRALYEKLVERAREQGQARLWVHASLNARPAFQALAFKVVRDETVFIGNQAFDRSEMALELS